MSKVSRPFTVLFWLIFYYSYIWSIFDPCPASLPRPPETLGISFLCHETTQGKQRRKSSCLSWSSKNSNTYLLVGNFTTSLPASLGRREDSEIEINQQWPLTQSIWLFIENLHKNPQIFGFRQVFRLMITHTDHFTILSGDWMLVGHWPLCRCVPSLRSFFFFTKRKSIIPFYLMTVHLWREWKLELLCPYNALFLGWRYSCEKIRQYSLPCSRETNNSKEEIFYDRL